MLMVKPFHFLLKEMSRLIDVDGKTISRNISEFIHLSLFSSYPI